MRALCPRALERTVLERRHEERGLLVRVLSVAELLLHAERDYFVVGDVFFDADLAAESAVDYRVIGRGRAEGLERELLLEFEREFLLLLEFLEHALVVGYVCDYRDVVVVLRGGADERNSADVYLFDELVEVGSALRRLFKRIERADYDVDEGNVEFRAVFVVLREAASCEYSAHYRRVQAFYAAAEYRGDAREVDDFRDLHAALFKIFRGAGAGYYFVSVGREPLCSSSAPVLSHTEISAFFFSTIPSLHFGFAGFLRKILSASFVELVLDGVNLRLERLYRVLRLAFHAFLREYRAVVDFLVDYVDGDARLGTPASHASRMPCAPGKRGRSAGWMLIMRPAKRRTKSGESMRMKPARTIQSAPASFPPRALSLSSASALPSSL